MRNDLTHYGPELEKCIELQRLPEIPRNPQFGHPRPIPRSIGGSHGNDRRLSTPGVLAKLAEYLPPVELRKVQIQKQEVRPRSASGLSYESNPSERFRAVMDNIQPMQDVMLLKSLLHKEHIARVVLRQKYDGAHLEIVGARDGL